MVVVFAMAGTIWGIGAAMRTPMQARWLMLGLLFVGVLAIHILLPDGHPLREGTGGSAALWLIIAGMGGLGALYFRGLSWLRTRANPDGIPLDPEAQPDTLGEVELQR